MCTSPSRPGSSSMNAPYSLSCTTLPVTMSSTWNFSLMMDHGSGVVCFRPREIFPFSLFIERILTFTLSPIFRTSLGCLSLPHEISEMWRSPSIPPRSMNAPYSVKRITVPSTMSPSLKVSQISSTFCCLSSERTALCENTALLPLLSSTLVTLTGRTCPRNSSALSTNLFESCDRGMNPDASL